MQQSVGDQSIYIKTAGDPNGSAVIFVHGAGENHEAWLGQLDGLAASGYFLLAPDLPGHGASSGAPLQSVGALSDWLTQLLDSLGRSSATIVGHSLGALIALDFAARHSERADAIALLGIVPRMAVNADLLSLAKANDRLAAKLSASWSCRKSAESDLVRQQSEQRLLAAGPGVLWQDLSAYDNYLECASVAATVSCPVAVISGDEDRMTPASGGAELAAMIAHANYRVLENAGHNMMLEQPARLNALLLEELR